jgi:ureidoacrylate peracid hydrolase
MHRIEIDQDVLGRVVAWRGRPHMFNDLDPRRTAHLIIDMQNGFLEQGSELEVPEAREIIPAINRISAAVREAGGLNVFVKFVVDDETKRTWPVWLAYFCRPDRAAAMGDLFSEGAHGGALSPDLDRREGDLVVPKARFSAFVPGSSDLHAILQARGIDTLIISGTVTNCCCESTARDAMQMNYKVIFATDGTAALSDADHNATLNNMLSIFADVMNADEVGGFLKAATAPGVLEPVL